MTVVARSVATPSASSSPTSSAANKGGPNEGEQEPPEIASTRQRWTREQRALASQVILSDDALPFDLPLSNAEFVKFAQRSDPRWAPPPSPSPSTTTTTTQRPPLTLIGGVDISFVKGTNIAVSSIAIMTFPELKLVKTLMQHCEMTHPYICTFLAFREIPALVPLLGELRRSFPQFMPQLIFVDGNGVHHPRRCGLASHFGVVCDVPTIGVAKDFLAVDGLKKDHVLADLNKLVAMGQASTNAQQQIVDAAKKKSHKHATPLDQVTTMPLVGHNHEQTLWGHVMLTGNSTKNPIYVSPGHKVSFGTAAALTALCAVNRIPEPIRQADLLSRDYIRKHFAELASTH